VNFQTDKLNFHSNFSILKFVEVPIRFELMHKGFADLSLTTWVRHRMHRKTFTSRSFRPEDFLNGSKRKSRLEEQDGLFERETGLEPATSTLARLRSTN
jgi:hypothetical protein